MSEWNEVIDGMDYDELQYPDEDEETYQVRMDYNFDMEDEE